MKKKSFHFHCCKNSMYFPKTWSPENYCKHISFSIFNKEQENSRTRAAQWTHRKIAKAWTYRLSCLLFSKISCFQMGGLGQRKLILLLLVLYLFFRKAKGAHCQVLSHCCFFLTQDSLKLGSEREGKYTANQDLYTCLYANLAALTCEFCK